MDNSRIDREITGEIYNSDESWEAVKALCGFGSRFGGLKSERQAVEYILGKFEGYGLDDPHLEEFEYINWKRGSSHLRVVSPLEHEIPCIGQMYSASGVVEAPLINGEYGHPDVFKRLGDDVKGSIVIVQRPSREAIAAGKALPGTPSTMYTRVVKAGAGGFIWWNQNPGQSALVRTMHYNLPGEIPATGVSYENGRLLVDLLERGPVTLEMKERHETSEMKSWNVVAEIEGTSKRDEIVFCGAHFDGVDISQGAYDDAGGAVVVMEAARALAKHRGSFKRTLKFATFTLEEWGLLGSFAYVQAHKDECKRIRFMWNLDGAAASGAAGLGISIQGRPELIPYFESIFQDMKLPYGAVVADRVSLHSDHLPFLLQGVPTASGARSDLERAAGWSHLLGWSHTVADTIDKMRPEFLRSAAITAARVLMRVANSDEIPARHLTMEETKGLIDERGYTERLYNLRYRSPEELAKRGVFD
ncbi:MAG: M28 family peptidase [Candidatus Bathyarchaeota archaeon]|nr:M28 family peptidase [Candidatus Bathyarchaeota archaeon]